MGTYEELVTILRKHDRWVNKLDRLDAIETPSGVLDISKYHRDENTLRIGTGFSHLDNSFGGFSEGGLTVVTGKRGSGKSVFASQLSLNAVMLGTSVCFYSGELNAHMFQSWVFQQAAGPLAVESYLDQFKCTRHRASREYEPLIREWLSGKFFLSDNETVGSSEHEVILSRFLSMNKHHGCKLFFVDNLMTTHFGEGTTDFYRQQSAFVGKLVEFAQVNRCHIILVAHPKKGDSGDANDNVAGTADITNRASIVLNVDRSKDGFGNIVNIQKNREYGNIGKVDFNYQVETKRFLQVGGTMITRYGWEP